MKLTKCHIYLKTSTTRNFKPSCHKHLVHIYIKHITKNSDSFSLKSQNDMRLT